MDVERHVTVLHGGAGRRGGKRLRYRSFPRVARQGFVVPVGDCGHRPPVGGRRGQPVQLHRDGDAREHLEPGAVRGPPPRYRPGQTAFSGPFPRPRIHRPTSRDGAGGHRPGHRQQPAEHRVLRRGPPLAANRPPGPGPAPERLLPPGSGGEPPRGAARAPSLAVLRVWHMLFVQSSTDKPPLSCADAAVTADNRALSGVTKPIRLTRCCMQGGRSVAKWSQSDMDAGRRGPAERTTNGMSAALSSACRCLDHFRFRRDGPAIMVSGLVG